MIYTDCLIGETMRFFRLKFKIKLEDIAIKLGISQPTLSRVEMGTTSIKFYVILAFCQVIDIDMEEFLNHMNGIKIKAVA